MDPLKVLLGKGGQPHLSFSMVKKFKDAPGVFALQYLLHVPDEAGPWAWVGSAVEAGLDHYLFGTPDMAIKAMYMAFEERAQGVADDKTAEARGRLPEYLIQARRAFENLPTPLSRQHRIVTNIPGLPDLPLTGFVDYLWPDHGRDLKTKKALPRQPDPDHVQQMSCYMRAVERPFWLAYATPAKNASYEVTKDMAAEAFDKFSINAHNLVHAIRKADSPKDFLRMYGHDFSSFYWSPSLVEAYHGATA